MPGTRIIWTLIFCFQLADSQMIDWLINRLRGEMAEKKIPCEICKLIIHDILQETENVINSHGIYIYHFKEEFPAAYDVDTDPGIVAVDRIHRSIKISKQGKVEQGIADLMAFLNSM